jgi:glyoxylase-like metal-dependent hydrolase (beta-lactamase superfamily II)
MWPVEAQQPAPGVVRVPVLFVNAYLIDITPEVPGDGWVLVDTGLPGLGGKEVQRAAAHRYGKRPPRAIVLTHGHFDHAGSARSLASAWQATVYAHSLELPYLTGRSKYPPIDPTVGGAFAMMSRTFPRGGTDLGDRVQFLPDQGSIPELPGWRAIHTPGHTAGHISLWRDSDKTLLAGDALATMNQESWTRGSRLPAELRPPPAPLTTDWHAARQSVHRLSILRPTAIVAGHGLPMVGAEVADKLEVFAANFTPPRRGRYVRQPVYADNRGVLSVPPAVRDPMRGLMRGAAAAAGVAALFAAIGRIRRRT